MRTASLVTGIIGSVIAIVLGVLFLLSALLWTPAGEFLRSEIDEWSGGDMPTTMEEAVDKAMSNEQAAWFANFFGIDTGFFVLGWAQSVIILFAVLFFVGGFVGLIGAAIIRRSYVASGVMQLCASVIAGLGVITFILLLLGGTLALAYGNRKEQAAAQ